MASESTYSNIIFGMRGFGGPAGNEYIGKSSSFDILWQQLAIMKVTSGKNVSDNCNLLLARACGVPVSWRWAADWPRR